ncbi:IclR family transcriptional regulator [Roseomonas elaeocarpi]|uniref:IclR family transcriptional regulator n=1 Tax=Roseomonas elaeocarpi TaxID=907779 RepID=A0ABV6JX59_9PROT
MTTLSTAAAVLRCFSAQRPELSTSDVATILGLPKSNASRLLRAMREAGFLETAPGSRRYRPGLPTFELGQVFRRGSRLTRLVQEAALRLTRARNQASHVAILEGRSVVPIFARESARTLPPVPGEHLPAEGTAAGLALLARLEPAELAALYDEMPGDRPAPEALGTVREDGIAALHDPDSDTTTFAAALADPGTGEAVALALTGTPAEGEATRAALLGEVRRIAAVVGDRAMLRTRQGEALRSAA